MAIDFYNNFKKAAERRGENVTAVTVKVGGSNATPTAWKKGASPSFEMAAKIANHLNISLDELAYGEPANYEWLRQDEQEIVDIYRAIPESRRTICRDFLKTHMAVDEK